MPDHPSVARRHTGLGHRLRPWFAKTPQQVCVSLTTSRGWFTDLYTSAQLQLHRPLQHQRQALMHFLQETLRSILFWKPFPRIAPRMPLLGVALLTIPMRTRLLNQQPSMIGSSTLLPPPPPPSPSLPLRTSSTSSSPMSRSSCSMQIFKQSGTISARLSRKSLPPPTP